MASERGGVDNRRTPGLLHLHIHKSSLGRSLLIVQGLTDEAAPPGATTWRHTTATAVTADWAETYVSEIDPLGGPVAPGHLPEPEPKDLVPFLGGLSAPTGRGPDEVVILNS